MPKNVLVIDDHPLFQEAMASLVESLEPAARVHRAGTAEEGLQYLREHDEVQLVLMDLGLPGAAGVDAFRMVRRACEGTIVVVSGSDHRQEIDAVGRAGATVVVSKGAPHAKLREVVQAALENRAPAEGWIRPTHALPVMQAQSVARLTARQRQIATLLMNGHSNKEIDIEDGRITGREVDALPIVGRTAVSTEATVVEGDALLIAGYSSQQNVASRQQVPVLGDLPGIGSLFSSQARTVQKRERMFLIRPRVVALESGTPSAALTPAAPALAR